MPIRKFAIGEAVRFGWEKAKKHFWFFVAVIVCTLLVSIAVNIVSGPRPTPNYGSGFGTAQFNQPAVPHPPTARNAIGGLLGFILGIFIEIGVIRISLKMQDDVRGNLQDFFPDWKLFFRMLGGNILYFLIVLAGFILLIIPGIIWAIKYRFYSYLVVDKNLGPVAALKESGRITRGEKGHLFLFYLALAGVEILGAIVLLIGLLWAAPTVWVATAFVYRKLAGHSSAAPAAASAVA